MQYIIGNWKANKTTTEVKEWLHVVREARLRPPPETTIILCPSFIHLDLIKKELSANPLGFDLKLGAQNLSPFPEGTYTGEVAARMLAEFVEYVILGHSERRQHFKESDQEINLKLKQALKHNIIPLIAFSQLNQIELAVQDLGENETKQILLMYEPPEAISKQIGAIGTGQAASLEQILGMIEKVKRLLPQNKILYGGSIKSDNINLYLDHPEIDGVVPGTASMNAEEFTKMIENAKNQTSTL